MNYWWILGTCGLSSIGLWLYLTYSRPSSSGSVNSKKSNSHPVNQALKPENKTIYEPIRQTALVQTDEFDTFYLPVLKRINGYEGVVGLPRTESVIQTLLLKSLRLRKSAIFEVESPETDRQNTPVWTLALFLAINCRYAVRLLNSCRFTDAKGVLINPYLEKPQALHGLNKHQTGINPTYNPDYIYHHIIDNIISPSLIKLLHNKKVYEFVVNAVIGFYEYRKMPFYRIIEDVENHVFQSQANTDQERFNDTLTHILGLIESNTVLKNTKESLVFESRSVLYVDRHLFWELFRTYHVHDQALMGKHEFEQRLIKSLGLYKTAVRPDTVQIYLNEAHNITQECVNASLEIKNTIALPYSKLPHYSPSHRLRVECDILKREVILDTESDLAQAPRNASDQPPTQSENDDQNISSLVKNTVKPSPREEVFESDKIN